MQEQYYGIGETAGKIYKTLAQKGAMTPLGCGSSKLASTLPTS